MRVENVKGAVWTVDEVEFYKRRPQRCPSGAAGIGAGLAQVAGYVKNCPEMAHKNAPIHIIFQHFLYIFTLLYYFVVFYLYIFVFLYIFKRFF